MQDNRTNPTASGLSRRGLLTLGGAAAAGGLLTLARPRVVLAQPTALQALQAGENPPDWNLGGYEPIYAQRMLLTTVPLVNLIQQPNHWPSAKMWGEAHDSVKALFTHLGEIGYNAHASRNWGKYIRNRQAARPQFERNMAGLGVKLPADFWGKGESSLHKHGGGVADYRAFVNNTLGFYHHMAGNARAGVLPPHLAGAPPVRATRRGPGLGLAAAPPFQVCWDESGQVIPCPPPIPPGCFNGGSGCNSDPDPSCLDDNGLIVPCYNITIGGGCFDESGTISVACASGGIISPLGGIMFAAAGIALSAFGVTEAVCLGFAMVAIAIDIFSWCCE